VRCLFAYTTSVLDMRTFSSIYFAILTSPIKPFLFRYNNRPICSILPSGTLIFISVVSLCPYNQRWPILVELLKLRPGDGAMLTTKSACTIQLAPELKRSFLLIFALHFSHATLTTHLAHLGPRMSGFSTSR
jgi:hypothetical protein